MKQLIYNSLLLIITIHFTCGETKILKNSQKVSKYYEHDCSYSSSPKKINVSVMIALADVLKLSFGQICDYYDEAVSFPVSKRFRPFLTTSQVN